MVTSILSIFSGIFALYLCIVRFIYYKIDNNEHCKISYEDAYNPKKWKSYAIGTYKEWLFPKHELEQLFILRYIEPKCAPCLEKGCCLNCGCNTYAKMLDPNAMCSENHWRPMMSQRQWNNFKNTFTPKVKITYFDE